MSSSRVVQCCYCGLKPIPGPESSSINYSHGAQRALGNQKVLLILEALGISPSNVLKPDEDYQVCTGCCDVVSFVTAVQVRLERAKSLLNSKSCEGAGSKDGQHSSSEFTSCCNLMSSVIAAKGRLKNVRSLLKKQACSALGLEHGQTGSELLGYKLSQCYKDCRVKLLPEDTVSVDVIKEIEDRKNQSCNGAVNSSHAGESDEPTNHERSSSKLRTSCRSKSKSRNVEIPNVDTKQEEADADAEPCTSLNGFSTMTDELDVGNLHWFSGEHNSSSENEIEPPDEKRIKLEFSAEPNTNSRCKRYNTRTRDVEPGFYDREPPQVIDVDDSSESETFEPTVDSEEESESDFDMAEEEDYHPKRSKKTFSRAPKKKLAAKAKKKKITQKPRIHHKIDRSQKIRNDRIPNWCALCLSAEAPDHLEKKHNLVCPKRKFYYCHTCLRAFEPPDKKTPTGYYNIRNHAGFFKEFAATHRECTDKPKSQSCKFCPRLLPNGFECITHEYHEHSHDTKVRPDYFRCTVCSYKCSAIKYLLKHMKKNDEEHLDAAGDSTRTFGCSFCGMEFQTSEGLVDHVGHHKTSEISSSDLCVLCDDAEETPAADLVGHYYKQHGLDYINFMYLSCVECSAAFQSTSGRPSGIATTEDREELRCFVKKHSACKNSIEGCQKCQFCPETVARFSLFEHELTQHPKDLLPCQKRMTCQYCHLPCDKPEQIAQHNRFHQLGTNLRNAWPSAKSKVPISKTAEGSPCPKCRRSFDTPEALQTHKNIHLMDEQIHGVPLNLIRYDSDKCPLCNYHSCHHLTQHIKREHNLIRWKIRRSNGDFYCCRNCLAPFPPSDPDVPAGKYLPNDIELEVLAIFASEHKQVCRRPKFTDFECIHCVGTTFKNVKELAIHDTREHPENNGFTCQYCEAKIGKEHHLRRHIKDHHAQQLIFQRKCHRCWLPFKTLEDLKAHYDQTDLSSPTSLLTYAGFPCLSCDLIFDSVALLTLHIQEVHDKLEHLNFHCVRCAITFDSLDYAVAAATSSTSSAEAPKYALKAASGFSKFRTFTALSSQHFQDCMAEHQSDPCSTHLEPNLTCYSCNKDFTNTKDFSIHLNSHVDVPQVLPCPVCTLLLPSEPSLINHVLKWHNLKSPVVHFYHCNTCFLPWKHTRSSYFQGKLLPEDAEDFLSFVDQHPEDCSLEKKTTYSCDICEFETNILQSFYTHNENMHSKQNQMVRKPQPYKKKTVGEHLSCKFCDVTFSRSADRTRHMNTYHSKEPEVIFKDEEYF